jgi:hypothetical protein
VDRRRSMDTMMKRKISVSSGIRILIILSPTRSLVIIMMMIIIIITIPDEVIEFFNLPNPSSRTTALGSTQPLRVMSTRNLPGG